MQIEMCCPRCFRRFPRPDTVGEALLEGMFDDEPCYALGDGETFEDMISSALTDHGPMYCTACGTLLQFSEESLGQLALTMLTRM